MGTNIMVMVVFVSIGYQHGYSRTFMEDEDDKNLDNKAQALNYLRKYGWLGHSDGPVEVNSQDLFKNTIAGFQRFAGLEVTGVIDEATKTLMSKPRCDFPDVFTAKNESRKKRFAPTGQPWLKRNLSWFLENDSRDVKLNRTDVESEIGRALQRWADAAGILTFFKAPDVNSADILLSFQVGNHSSDYRPFDGPGGSIAHAFPPGTGIGGDVHFDDDDQFLIHESGRYNLHQVATHELGHSLGLGHLSDSTAVMAPFYRDVDPTDFQLQPSDISYIRILYGTCDDIDTTPAPETAHTPSASSRIQLTTLLPATTTTKISFDDGDSSPVLQTEHPLPPKSSTYPTTLTPTSIPTMLTSDGRNDSLVSESAHPRPPTSVAPTSIPTMLTSDGRDDSLVSESAYPRPPTSRTYPTALTPTSIPTMLTSDGKDDFRVSQSAHPRPPASRTYPTTSAPTPTTTPRTIQAMHCNAQFDAATETLDGGVYFFQGEQVFKVRLSVGIVDGYPKRLSEEFSGLNIRFIDAALTYHVNSTFIAICIFKSDNYWLFDQSGIIQPGYPKNITANWGGVPANLDAAFTWRGNGFVYFIKGSHYYRYNPRIGRVETGYPRPLRNWRGVETPVDGVFRYKGQTFFLREQYYQNFDDRKFIASDKVPSAPKWLRCGTDLLEDNNTIATDVTGKTAGCGIIRSQYALTWIIYGAYLLMQY